MLSRLTESLKDLVPAEPRESQQPTLSFPPPPPAGSGTRSLCARCLTLLSHITTEYGDGTEYKDLEILHSGCLPDLWREGPNDASTHAQKKSSIFATLRVLPSCVLCTKSLILIDAAMAHISFEPSLRDTPYKEWSLHWKIDAPDPKIYPQFAFPHDSLSVLININHKRGYGWGIGGFNIYPDWSAVATAGAEQKKNLGDYPIITSLDMFDGATADMDADLPEPDFPSTLGPGSLALIISWISECAKAHPKCRRKFGTSSPVRLGTAWLPTQPEANWFPDRLIHMPCTSRPAGWKLLSARVVQKCNHSDFPPSRVAKGIMYMSFSHCWGAPPDPSAPLGGRARSVLTKSNLSAWQENLPLDDLPLAFQHAIKVCASLGCGYLWIDSLCILQDSLEDWQAQSAVMGNIYKFATINIAALSSASDYEGFINESRDTRIQFGFRASFASIMGRGREEKNQSGQDCVLLRGRSKLLWKFSSSLPASNASNAPLFSRAWVYQERCLARRTLAFTTDSVYWACDEGSRGEQPDWGLAGLEAPGLRHTLHTVEETAAIVVRSDTESEAGLRRRREAARSLVVGFDMRWHSCVTSYTLCKLTKHTDKLVAISAVARDLNDMLALGRRYLAGLWEINLPSQMAWITVNGRSTPPRARVGNVAYVAPSWSWASIDAPVQPGTFCYFGNEMVALADVREAETALETDNAFGSVKAGWLRVWGRLNRVRAAEGKVNRGRDKTYSLIDAATNEELWFCSDTVEGYELVESEKSIEGIVWTPLTLRFDNRMVECTCLVLIEDEVRTGDPFVKTGEKVYRRIGSGNFGRAPSMLRQDKLLLGLGDFPNVQVSNEQGKELANGFKIREADFEEFVLV